MRTKYFEGLSALRGKNLAYRYDIYQQNTTGEYKVNVQEYGFDQNGKFGPAIVDQNRAYQHINKTWWQ